SRIDKRASMREEFLERIQRFNSNIRRPSESKLANVGIRRSLANYSSRCRGSEKLEADFRPNPQLAETYLLEGPADPGALILARLKAAGFNKFIGVFVPTAVWKIVPKHRRCRLCLADNADGHIGLGKSLQRFFDMTRGLVLRDDSLEAV